MTARLQASVAPGPLAEPRVHDWDETPAEAARFDDQHWDNLYDRDED